MTLRTEVTALRRVAAGEAVGYGGVFRAPRSGRVATLPMGYADGIPWSLGRAGAGGTVLVAGRRCAIAGRISMDLTTVWLEDEAVALGDEAIVFGAGAPVEALAAAADTLPYELLVRVGGRVPRTAIG
jgi:alanine racemase